MIITKEVNQNVVTSHSLSSYMDTATEGDLNMHSSKGFYKTILVTEESHPVTALEPVMVSVYTVHDVRLCPGMQWTLCSDRSNHH